MDGGEVIIKIRFQCEKCSELFDVAGSEISAGPYLAELRRAGWKVVAEQYGTRHYCPACEPGEF